MNTAETRLCPYAIAGVGSRSTTSQAEVTNISQHGFWLLLDERELFLPFEEYPWFKRAPVEAILRL